ncbi:hypothetical protein P5673_030313, partial [Acropora cervicornis]
DLKALKEALSTLENQVDSEQQRSLNEDILSFAELVLKSNNFEFNGNHYLQKRGTAIGMRLAPSYTNIFMDRLERRLIRNAEVKPRIWWQYIDDIVWTEGEEKLQKFIDYLNSAHETIKFSYKWATVIYPDEDSCTELKYSHFLQKHGTAIGTRMAPAYANLFMHHLESQLLNLAPVKPYLWLRYIDDIFMIWTAGEQSLLEFLQWINQLHNNI